MVIEYLGSYANNEDFKLFLKGLEPEIIAKNDNKIKIEVENELQKNGVNIGDLVFHEGANHLEWKKDGKDFFVIERHC